MNTLTINPIAALADELRTLLARVSQSSHEALTTGHRLGSALIVAREAMDQGAFTILLEQARIQPEQVKRLTNFARDYSLEEIEQGNSTALRQGMLSLGCLPQKDAIEHEGDEPVTVNRSHGAIVNAFSRLMSAITKQRAALDEVAVRHDTRELYHWLKGIHEGGKQ